MVDRTQDGSKPCHCIHPHITQYHRSTAARVLPLAVLGSMALTLPSFAQARTAAPPAAVGKSDSFLRPQIIAPPARGWSSVIVRLAHPLTAQEQASLTALHADVRRHLPIINSLAVQVPARSLGQLAALPFVQHLSADTAVRKCDEFTVGSSGADTAFSRYSLTGTGVTVAVVDTGVRKAKDLSGHGSRLLSSVSFVADGQDTDDACGHGTHVAGIIAGDGTSSEGKKYFRTFYGIARQAGLVNVRVLDDQGRGSVSQVVAGLQWVIANRKSYHIRVINLSLGHPVGESYTTDPLCLAVEAAWKAGIVVVCPAGNDGRLQNTSPTPDPSLDNEGFGTAYGSIQSPGNDPSVITVGATKSLDGIRAHDRIATYSSRGPSRLDHILKPDLIAPGNKVISLLADGSYLDKTYAATGAVPLSSYAFKGKGDQASERYFMLSGTSMAAPVVAGAAALMLQQDPSLSPDTIKARLMVSADKWADPAGRFDPCTYGAGYLDIPAALQCTATLTGTALSPALSRDASGAITMDSVLWGNQVTWTNSVLWGNQVVWTNDMVWGSHVTWTNTVLWGNHVAWTNTVLWGNSSVWDEHVTWANTTTAVDLTSTALRGE